MTAETYSPVYRALVGMRVKFPVGTMHRGKKGDNSYIELRPGDDIPGAENWPNPALELKRRRIERIDGKTDVAPVRGEYVPPHATTAEDMKRAHITNLGKSFPAATPEDIGPGKDKPSMALELSDNQMDSLNAEAAKNGTKAKVDSKALSRLEAQRKKAAAKFVAGKKNMVVNGKDDEDARVGALLKR